MPLMYVYCSCLIFYWLLFSANRAVEVNEMWRVRQKELEMDDRLRERSGYDNNCSKNCGDVGDIPRSTGRRHFVNENNTRVSSSSSKRVGSSYLGEDEGLKDEEVEEFLHSRSLKNAFSHAHIFFLSSVDSFH